MRILIIGGGGREHAIGHALSLSGRRPELYFAPGNAGTATIGTNIPIAPDDIDALRRFAQEHAIDLTIVGPEVPLVKGIVDLFEAESLPIVGPTAAAARLEGSKAFAKAFMARHRIPTAEHRTFSRSQYDEARAYVEGHGAPIVLKASGLAAGKGAIVCASEDEARHALDAVLLSNDFGSAGDELVVEECMEGEEASVFVLTDGISHRTLLPAQDHKRIGEGDTGPNTGGMGAYAPAPVMDDALMHRVDAEIVRPTLTAMADEGHPYRGILYVGLMMTEQGPRVIEYNCRLGDPEAQAVLPMMENDAVEVFEAIAHRRLDQVSLRSRSGSAATVVMASGGYPGRYSKGHEIRGLETVRGLDDVLIFHAGTTTDEAGRVVTSGGRVLSVTAVAPTLSDAISRAYEAANHIEFEGKYLRRDIGRRGLAYQT